MRTAANNAHIDFVPFQADGQAMADYIKRYGLEADWQGWLTKAGERVAYKIPAKDGRDFQVVWVDPAKREMVLNPVTRAARVKAAGTKGSASFTLTCDGVGDDSQNTMAGTYLAQDGFREFVIDYLKNLVSNAKFWQYDEDNTDPAGADGHMHIDSVVMDYDNLTIEADFSAKIQGTVTYEYATNSEFGNDEVRSAVWYALVHAIEDKVPGGDITMDKNPVNAKRVEKTAEGWLAQARKMMAKAENNSVLSQYALRNDIGFTLGFVFEDIEKQTGFGMPSQDKKAIEEVRRIKKAAGIMTAEELVPYIEQKYGVKILNKSERWKNGWRALTKERIERKVKDEKTRRAIYDELGTIWKATNDLADKTTNELLGKKPQEEQAESATVEEKEPVASVNPHMDTAAARVTAALQITKPGEGYSQEAIQSAIAGLKWEDYPADGKLPYTEGYAINAVRKEFNLPRPSKLALNGTIQPMNDKEGQHALYGINIPYKNADLILYIADTGTETFVVAKDEQWKGKDNEPATTAGKVEFLEVGDTVRFSYPGHSFEGKVGEIVDSDFKRTGVGIETVYQVEGEGIDPEDADSWATADELERVTAQRATAERVTEIKGPDGKVMFRVEKEHIQQYPRTKGKLTWFLDDAGGGNIVNGEESYVMKELDRLMEKHGIGKRKAMRSTAAAGDYEFYYIHTNMEHDKESGLLYAQRVKDYGYTIWSHSDEFGNWPGPQVDGFKTYEDAERAAKKKAPKAISYEEEMKRDNARRGALQDDPPERMPYGTTDLDEVFGDQDPSKVMAMKATATIHKEDDGYHVRSKDGKNLGGPYKTEKEAQDRLKQVETFKHKKAAAAKSDPANVTANRVKAWTEKDDLPENIRGKVTFIGKGYEIKKQKGTEEPTYVVTFAANEVVGDNDTEKTYDIGLRSENEVKIFKDLLKKNMVATAARKKYVAVSWPQSFGMMKEKEASLRDSKNILDTLNTLIDRYGILNDRGDIDKIVLDRPDGGDYIFYKEEGDMVSVRMYIDGNVVNQYLATGMDAKEAKENREETRKEIHKDWERTRKEFGTDAATAKAKPDDGPTDETYAVYGDSEFYRTGDKFYFSNEGRLVELTDDQADQLRAFLAKNTNIFKTEKEKVDALRKILIEDLGLIKRKMIELEMIAVKAKLQESHGDKVADLTRKVLSLARAVKSAYVGPTAVAIHPIADQIGVKARQVYNETHTDNWVTAAIDPMSRDPHSIRAKIDEIERDVRDLKLPLGLANVMANRLKDGLRELKKAIDNL